MSHSKLTSSVLALVALPATADPPAGITAEQPPPPPPLPLLPSARHPPHTLSPTVVPRTIAGSTQVSTGGSWSGGRTVRAATPPSSWSTCSATGFCQF